MEQITSSRTNPAENTPSITTTIPSINEDEIDDSEYKTTLTLDSTPQMPTFVTASGLPFIDKKAYAVVFYAKYYTVENPRPSEAQIQTYFTTYGQVDHTECPPDKNFAFVYMTSLNTTAEFSRTKNTITTIIRDMLPETRFHIGVASLKYQNRISADTLGMSQTDSMVDGQSNGQSNRQSNGQSNRGPRSFDSNSNSNRGPRQSNANRGSYQSDPNQQSTQVDSNRGPRSFDSNSNSNRGPRQSNANRGSYQSDPNQQSTQVDSNRGPRSFDSNSNSNRGPRQSNANRGSYQSDPNQQSMQVDSNQNSRHPYQQDSNRQFNSNSNRRPQQTDSNQQSDSRQFNSNSNRRPQQTDPNQQSDSRQFNSNSNSNQRSNQNSRPFNANRGPRQTDSNQQSDSNGPKRFNQSGGFNSNQSQNYTRGAYQTRSSSDSYVPITTWRDTVRGTPRPDSAVQAVQPIQSIQSESVDVQ